MNKYRSSNDITFDILHACASGSLSATKILYKANLAWYQGKQYIQELHINGLLEESECGYSTTNLGFAWLALEEKQAELLQKDEMVILAN